MSSLTEVITSLLSALIEAPPSVIGQEARLKARLFSGLLLSCGVFYTLATIIFYFPINWFDAGAILFLGLFYGLSRTSVYRAVIPVFIGASLFWAILQTADDPNAGSMIAFTILFAGIFATPRITAMVSVLSIVSYVLLGFIPTVAGTPDQIADILLFLILLAGLTIVLSFLTRNAWQKAETSLNELSASEAKFRAFVEQSSDGITLIDHLGRITEWNAALETLTGIKRETTIGQFSWDIQYGLLPPESQAAYNLAYIRERILAALCSDQSPLFQQPLEIEIYTTTGNRRQIQQTIFPIESAIGNGIASVSRDMTDQRLTIKALVASEEKFRTFFEQSSDGITLLDNQGRIIEWNAALQTMTGLPRAAALGQYAWDVQARITPPEKRTDSRDEAAKAALRNALDNDQSPLFRQTLAAEIYTGAGAHRYIQQTIFPVRSNNGFQIGSILRDTTESQLAERRAFDLALETERVQLLRRFIQQASHEFRTPLTIINAAVFFATRSDDPKKRHQKGETIERQVQRMSKLVDMLLKMAELESGVDSSRTLVDINRAFSDARHMLLERYGSKPTLDWRPSADRPMVLADAQNLAEAISQILDNAYRFSPPDGIITVSTSIIDDKVCLKISDSGPGISGEHLPHIFETFWRQDVAHTTPGFGLGLPIAQKIIETFGGSITVESSESSTAHGSTFSVMLPLTARHDTQQP